MFGAMFKVDEYRAIAPPLTPVLLRNEIFPERVMVLESAYIDVCGLSENATIPAILTLLDLKTVFASS